MSHTPASVDRRPDAEPSRPHDLRLAVVRYEDGPDRCTVSPRDADENRLLTHWLSVDARLLVPLDEMC